MINLAGLRSGYCNILKGLRLRVENLTSNFNLWRKKKLIMWKDKMVNGQKVEIMSVCERYCRVLHEILIRNLKMGILKTKTINKNKK